MEEVQLPVIPEIMDLYRKTPGAISLGQGVVNYTPPPQAIQQIQNFLSDPQNHKYAAVQGIPQLISALKSKLKIENNIEITEKNRICVSAGANMSFFNILLAIADPGDEIIILTPYYFNYEMAIRMANCTPVLVPTDPNYQILLEKIETAITPKTKAIVTISPNNPTGIIYTANSLQKVNLLCKRKNIFHISDEAYEYFLYDGATHFSSASIKDSEPYTVSLYSLSKAYGFASWRIGYMVYPEHLESAIRKVQDTILICPPIISQFAAVGALQAGSQYCKQHIHEIALVRDIVWKSLAPIQNHCQIVHSTGAFYFFIQIPTELDSVTLAKKLVTQFGVVTIPGEAFGMNNSCYLRISYGSLNKETAKEGIERLVKGIQTVLGG